MRSLSEHPWTQQNRARIGFAVFPRLAPLEPLSGSIRQSQIARKRADFDRLSERSETWGARCWRGWDSNPRATFAAAGFQDRVITYRPVSTWYKMARRIRASEPSF